MRKKKKKMMARMIGPFPNTSSGKAFEMITKSRAALLLTVCAMALPVSFVQALQIEQVTFPEHVMLGQTVTLVCEYTVGQSEFIDSIKWYKDSLEFYRIIPNTPIEHDRVVTFPRPGIKLEKEKSGVSKYTLGNRPWTQVVEGC